MFLYPAFFRRFASALTSLACGLALSPLTGQEATGIVYHDLNGNGTLDEGEPGLPGVSVSNQREIVETDEAGRWVLPVDDDTIFFVIKPRDWMTPVNKDKQIGRAHV